MSNLNKVAAIRAAFESGKVTVADVVKALKGKNMPSLATIRTQVGRLRNAAGLTESDRMGGPVSLIRTAFEAGATDVPTVVEAFQLAGASVPLATIRTQVGRLRKSAGLIRPASRKAPAVKTVKGNKAHA